MSLEKNIKFDEYQRVCRLAKLVEVANSKTYIFKTKDGVEGVEFVAGTIIPFLIKTNPDNTKEKVLDQPVGSKDILAVLGAFEEKEIKPIPEKTQEKNIESTAPEEKIALLPDFLTPALMSKWAKLSTTDRILMFQKTPNEQIYEVKVGTNPDTKKAVMASYVKGNYMFKEANAAFLFDWALIDIEISVCTTGVSVSGTLQGYFSEYGRYFSRPAVGYQELNAKVDVEQAKKGATTDAIKKGLSLFGFNSDVYSREV